MQPMESASNMVVVQNSAVYANGSDDARLLEQLEREEAAFEADGQARSRMEQAIAAINELPAGCRCRTLVTGMRR